MSKDWVKDIHEMQEYYGANKAVAQFDKEKIYQWLKFRFDFLKEEYTEGNDAVEAKDPEEIIDALWDLVVVSIGTLDSLQVDVYKGWDEILKSNMTKEVGIKPSRPNPLGLPDLIKPEGWVGPNHTGNHGILTEK